MVAKTFFPEIIEHIPASPPHPEDTQYHVSVCMEDWDDILIPVAKVQMVYNGSVTGRRSPSYPIRTNDHEKVNKAMGRLIKEALAKYDVSKKSK